VIKTNSFYANEFFALKSTSSIFIQTAAAVQHIHAPEVKYFKSRCDPKARNIQFSNRKNPGAPHLHKHLRLFIPHQLITISFVLRTAKTKKNAAEGSKFMQVRFRRHTGGIRTLACIHR